MKCYRCFFKINDVKFCSFCFKYGELKKIKPPYKKRKNNNSFYFLNYPLSFEQKQISLQILKTKRNVLIHAVCGAGKTEIVIATINQFLKQGKRVGFVIPRRILVKEITKRLIKIFPKNKVVACFKNLLPILGDIVVLTTHKIINYINQFDLVIIDEIDAFPLSEDIVLQKIALNLAREKSVIISATPPSYLIHHNFLNLKLFKRYHKHKLPIPIFKKTWNLPRTLFALLKKSINQKVIVYFPTIKLQKKYFNYFKDYFNIKIINSKSIKTNNILFDFVNKNLSIIFATSTLERGITIKNLNVIVIEADHNLFTKEVLEQISGRVGRVINFEKGWIYFLAKNKNQAIKACINQIKQYNKLSNLS